VDNAEDTAAFT